MWAYGGRICGRNNISHGYLADVKAISLDSIQQNFKKDDIIKIAYDLFNASFHAGANKS